MRHTAFCMNSALPPLQGPDGKWNQYTGRFAWDASCIVSNQREQFGGTGAFKKEELFAAAPNVDHSNVSPWCTAGSLLLAFT